MLSHIPLLIPAKMSIWLARKMKRNILSLCACVRVVFPLLLRVDAQREQPRVPVCAPAPAWPPQHTPGRHLLCRTVARRPALLKPQLAPRTKRASAKRKELLDPDCEGRVGSGRKGAADCSLSVHYLATSHLFAHGGSFCSPMQKLAHFYFATKESSQLERGPAMALNAHPHLRQWRPAAPPGSPHASRRATLL